LSSAASERQDNPEGRQGKYHRQGKADGIALYAAKRRGMGGFKGGVMMSRFHTNPRR